MPDRPETSKVLTPDDLLPGDVLLSRGETSCEDGKKLPTSLEDLLAMVLRGEVPSLADAICGLDGGAYSHSSMWTKTGHREKEKGNAEATRKGVLLNPLAVDAGVQIYIDVFRFHSGKHHLDDEDWPAQPIVDRAYHYTDDGYGYAYDELVMLGVLLVMIKVPKKPIVKWLVKYVLPLVLEWIHDNITSKDKQAMVCTELVCRCYWEADDTPTHKYAMEIDIDGTRSILPLANTLLADLPQPEDELDDPELAKEYEKLTQACARALFGAQPEVIQSLAELHHQHLKVATQAAGGVQPLVAAAVKSKAGGDVPLGMISPRQLQESSSLELIGTLDTSSLPDD